MDEFSDLEQLSVAEKNALIRDLWPLRGQVHDRIAQVKALLPKMFLL